MELIDNDRVQRRKYAGNFDPAPHAQCLERLRCHQHDAIGVPSGSYLGRRRHITVPAMDRHLDRPAQRVEASELVVDQRFERADIEDVEAGSATARHSREEGQKRGFGLAARGRRGNDHISLALEEHRDRPLLDIPQFVPSLLPDPSPDGLAEEIEA